MTFKEKIIRLMDGKSRAEIERLAGLKSNTLSNMINAGNLPRLDRAYRIAHALGVSLDWLADDSQGWPPAVPGEPGGQARELVHAKVWSGFEKLASRYGGMQVALAAAVDWLVDSESGHVLVSLDDSVTRDEAEYVVSDEIASEAKERLRIANAEAARRASPPPSPSGGPGRQGGAEDAA